MNTCKPALLCFIALAFFAVISRLTSAFAADPTPVAKPSVPAAAHPATLPAIPPPALIGNVTISVKSASLGYADLQPCGGPRTNEISLDRLLVVRLEIHNTGKTDAPYKSFNGTTGHRDNASLIDAGRHFIALGDFGELEPAGITREAILKPGDTITDVLIFAPPAAPGDLTLMLPQVNLGQKGPTQLLQFHPDLTAAP